jgi:hypothetical protein
MQNYRVTFGGEQIDYHSNFAACRGYWPIIKAVLDILRTHGIEEAWWFFEPYVEITWLCDDKERAEKAMVAVSGLLESEQYKYQKFTPDDGIFGDWHGLTPEEREFGAKRYAALAKTSTHYYENLGIIEGGMGVEKHFARATHVLANQLGLNYEAEGIALLKRGFLCILFYHLGHQKAVDTYEKLFKEKYLGRDEDLS